MRTEPHKAVAPLVMSLLSERLERFETAAGAVADAAEAEAVHQLRVASRRLHAALTVVRPLADLPAGIRRRPVRRLERRFGALRDLDVLSALLQDLSPESAAVQALGPTLLAEREEASERGRAALQRRGLRRTRAALRAWLEDPVFTPLASMDPDLLLPELLAPTLTRLFLHPGWLVPDLPSPADAAAAALHMLRRQIKALRYRLECLTSWCGGEVAPWLDELHAMQDALGTWHDAGVLLGRLDAVGAGPGLTDRARARAALALAPWPAWRARYTQPGFRRLARGWIDRVRPVTA